MHYAADLEAAPAEQPIMPPAVQHPDLCVIGGSEAGLSACFGAVALGLSCVLVDDGDSSGLRNPDLVLATLAHVAADPARHAGVWDALAAALSKAAAERRHARYGALNVRLVRGSGRFTAPMTLLAGNVTIRARRFLIATGGCQPAAALARDLHPGRCLTVAKLPILRQVPKRMLVAGGGAEAVAAAQSFARLGVRVTLVADALLPDWDPEMVDPVLAALRRDSVGHVRGSLQILRPAPGGLVARLSDGTMVEAEHLLLAEETHPALDDLDLPRTGIVLDQGALRLGADQRTSRRGIFAAGRAGGAHTTAEGVAQAGVALRAAFLPLPARTRPERVPSVLEAVPQVVRVGETEGTRSARLYRWPLDHTGRSAATGHAKISTDGRGQILGASFVGAEVRELIAPWSLAIAQGLTLSDMAEAVPPQSSASESLRALALQDVARRLATPWAQRALRTLRWFR